MAEDTLSAAVAAKYNLVGHLPQKYVLGKNMNSIEVDFRTMTIEQADKLVAKGFKGLVLKTPAKAETTKTADTAKNS